MKLAIVGSRGIDHVDLRAYIPREVTEIVSGGAKGVDACAARYARKNGITLTEFLPEYARYGRAAPLRRNDTIVDHADAVLVFWDGRSSGSRYVIERCRRSNKPLTVVTMP